MRETNETVQARQDRTSRMDRRKQIVTALSNPYWLPFRLVELALDSKEPVIVDLNFTGQNFPGKYIYEIVEMLKSLEELGLVQISKDRSGQTAFEICISETDEVTRELIETLYQ